MIIVPINIIYGKNKIHKCEYWGLSSNVFYYHNHNITCCSECIYAYHFGRYFPFLLNNLTSEHPKSCRSLDCTGNQFKQLYDVNLCCL